MRGGTRNLSLFRSSHFRLVLWYTLLLGVASMAFGAFLFLGQVRDIEGEARTRVVWKVRDARRAMDMGGFPYLQEGEAYALFDADGRVEQAEGLTEERALSLAAAAASRKGDSAEARRDRHEEVTVWTEDRIDGGMSYGYVRPGGRNGTANGGAGAMLFGMPLDPYGLRRRLLFNLLIATAFMLAAAVLSGMWFVNHAMKPVARMARTAMSIGEGDLSRRIRLGTRDELGELSAVFDAMLDRLEEAFERQKRFVADAGHELRTPLSILSLESDRALASERPPQDYRQSLEVVRTECGYMAKLVDDLLALARADAGGDATAFGPVDLADVSVSVLERFSPMAASRGISLSAGDLPEAVVRGNRAALETMVGNLVDNAIKYARGPGGRVDMVLETGGDEAVLRVVDDGQGIPSGKIGRVFDRFYRVDEARSDAGNGPAGSGLGLSIVKAIAVSHGGKVEVESEPGRGSRFTVTLPLTREGAPKKP